MIPAGARSRRVLGQGWLRGVQFTDAHGLATFHGIFPGHYHGRTTQAQDLVYKAQHGSPARMTMA